MLKTLKVFYFILFCCLFSIESYATSGAYLVDDGAIIEKGKIQVESWYSQSNTGEKFYATNPTYQIFKNTEFSLQQAYSSKLRNPYSPRNNQNTLWPQVKYLWYDTESILSSVVFSENYSSTDQKIYGTYAYSTSTFKLNPLADIHLYLGWQNWRHAAANNKSTDFLNYGTSLDLHLTDKFSLVSEIFQNNGAFRNSAAKQPAMQLGSRYFFSQALTFDAIYGKNINGNRQNWLTLSATIVF